MVGTVRLNITNHFFTIMPVVNPAKELCMQCFAHVEPYTEGINVWKMHSMCRLSLLVQNNDGLSALNLVVNLSEHSPFPVSPTLKEICLPLFSPVLFQSQEQ